MLINLSLLSFSDLHLILNPKMTMAYYKIITMNDNDANFMIVERDF